MTSIPSGSPNCNSSDIVSKKNKRPRFETALRNNTILYKGRRGELAVQLTGVPPETVKWMFKNMVLTESERIRLHTSYEGWHKLIIDSVNNTDNGLYKVIASNEYGERDSHTYVQIEIGPPIISSLCKSDIKLKISEKLCIAVSIKDYGKDYQVKWFKNLSSITKDTAGIVMTKKQHMCSLKINSVHVKDTGQYKCIVSSIGETSIKFNVDVAAEEQKKLKECDDCWHGNGGIHNQSINNRSASLGNLLEVTVTQPNTRKSSLHITENTNMFEHNKEMKACVFPDIYSSLTPSNNRNGIRSKNMLIPLKTFFKETLHFGKQPSNATFYKAKSFSNFRERSDDEKIKQCSEDLALQKQCNAVPNESLKTKSACLSNLHNTYKRSTNINDSNLGINVKRLPTNKSLVETMKHSIGRGICKAKCFVGFEGKSTPPRLLKYSNTNECSDNECTESTPTEEEENLFVTHLTHEDKQTMETTLQTKINGSYKWEMLTLKLCEKGYIQIDKNEVELCKYPYRINIGKELIQILATCKPDFIVEEFSRVAKNRNRKDICKMLAPFDQMKLTDIPCIERQNLEILLQISLPGYTWKLLAEDFELSDNCINSIDASLHSVAPTSPVKEIFNAFQTRNPMMTLHCIVRTLRELHFNDSASSLEHIMKEKRKQIRLLQPVTSSTPYIFLIATSPFSEPRSACM